MKILLVCSGNEGTSPIIKEFASSIIRKGIEVDYFYVKGRGFYGYLNNLSSLKKKIRQENYDIVHAMFGLCGMLSVLQRVCPVIITFMGCDVNRNDLRVISRLAMKFSSYNIFVDQRLSNILNAKKRYSDIPFGVDFENTFFQMDKKECRKKLGLDPEVKIALFASTFDRIEKNYVLAREAVEIIGDVELIELNNKYKRHEVNLLLNACDLLLMTSIREGSPQIIKEAMACNCPIVSTDVGDVIDVIKDTQGCYMTSFDPIDVSEKIKEALRFGRKTDGRQRIKHFGVNIIAEKIIDIYNSVLA